MDLEITLHDGISVVKIRGKIVDGQPAEDLQDALGGLVRQKKIHTIFDLSQVEWFDSLAIGILASHYVSVTRLGGRVLLLGASQRIKTMLRMVRIHDRFGWAQDLDEALNWFKS